MHINMSEENNKRFLSLIKYLVDHSINISSDKSSSVKKLVSAFLLIPVIIPTGLTISLCICTYFFTNAVNFKPDDSKLSKLIKGLFKLPIYVIAAVILIPCIILNLAVSSVPLLIFLAINKNIGNDKKSSVIAGSDSEYNKLIEEEFAKFNHNEHNLSTEKHEDNKNNHGHSQVVQIISRNMGSKENVDQTTVTSGINDRNIKDGKAMVRIVGNDRNFTMTGIIAGDMRDYLEANASAFVLECQIVPDGLDFQFGYKMRTGNTQEKAIRKLMQDESVRTMLSGNSEILPIQNVVPPCASIKEL